VVAAPRNDRNRTPGSVLHARPFQSPRFVHPPMEPLAAGRRAGGWSTKPDV